MTTVVPSSTADRKNQLQPIKSLDTRVGTECKRTLSGQDNVAPETKRIKVEDSVVCSTIEPSVGTSSINTSTTTTTTTTTTVFPDENNQNTVLAYEATDKMRKISPTNTNADYMNTIVSKPDAGSVKKRVDLGHSQTRRDTAKSTATVTSSSSSSSGSSMVATAAAPGTPGPQAPPSKLQSSKSTLMSHLHTKYHAELEYMLREFRKLERQLLGAKGNGSGIEESAGSRERREKLHSFILHLEDTIRQIDVGCKLEAEGKGTSVSSASISNNHVIKEEVLSAAINSSSDGKDEEENVQKLEDHILANLLPVKVRLIKQLAAQQGATRNPIGMPVARRGLQPSTAANKGKGTFAAAAEERRKQAEAAREAAQQQSLSATKLQNSSQSPSQNITEVSLQRPLQIQSTLIQGQSQTSSQLAPSQFGNPLSGNGSSLTQKLHGTTLGSEKRVHGHGVGSPLPNAAESIPLSMEGHEDTSKRKILYGGMVPGSKQIQSGVSAAVGVHDMIIESAELKSQVPAGTQMINRQQCSSAMPTTTVITQNGASHHLSTVAPRGRLKPHEDPNLSIEERKKLRKERRKRKKARDLRRREKERQRQLFLQQQAAQMPQPRVHGKKIGKCGTLKGAGKKKGPRSVEYICALCSEAYSSTCEFNPWWALTSHECPKCRKSQVPRIDITSVANAIEYHPALLAHAEDASGGGGAMASSSNPVPAMSTIHHVGVSHINSQGYHKRALHQNSKIPGYPASDSDEESDLSELSDAGDLSDTSLDQNGIDNESSLTEGELAELEVFGKEYDGPKLTPDHASRLLVMMAHAQTCPGRHKSVKHRDCCNSVKFMMLHVRDCPGTTASFDVCPFPWCRKVKHLLYHLVACPRPKNCAICSPIALSKNLKNLIGLNDHRRCKQRERRKAVMAAAAAAAKSKPPQSKIPFISKTMKTPVYRSHTNTKKPVISINRNYKGSNQKPISTGVPRMTQISRGVNKPGMTATRTLGPKGTNGVVVKSLVKPAGKSSMVVVNNTRSQRSIQHKPIGTLLPRVSGAKSTIVTAPDGSRPKPMVAALPGVNVIDPSLKLKAVSVTEQVSSASSVPTTAPPSTSTTQNNLSIIGGTAPAPSETPNKTSSEIVKACAAAQAALAVNALEQAAKAAMEESTSPVGLAKLEVNTSSKAVVPNDQLVINTETNLAHMKKDNMKKPSPAPINTQAVATASAIAASMATVDGTSSDSNGIAPVVASRLDCKSGSITPIETVAQNSLNNLIAKQEPLADITKQIKSSQGAQVKTDICDFGVGNCMQTVKPEFLEMSSENNAQHEIAASISTVTQSDQPSSNLSPPRFPEVPVVVKEETTSETKKEVPPV